MQYCKIRQGKLDKWTVLYHTCDHSQLCECMPFYVVLKFWSLCCCRYVLCLHLYSSSQWPSNSCEGGGRRPAHTEDLMETPREGSMEWGDPRLLRGLQACFIWQAFPVWDCWIQQRGREGTSSADQQPEVRVCEMIRLLIDSGLKCRTVLKLKIIRKMYHFRLSMRVGNPSCFIVLWLCSWVVACCTCDSEHCPASCRSTVAVILETFVNDKCAMYYTFILDIFWHLTYVKSQKCRSHTKICVTGVVSNFLTWQNTCRHPHHSPSHTTPGFCSVLVVFGWSCCSFWFVTKSARTCDMQITIMWHCVVW